MQFSKDMNMIIKKHNWDKLVAMTDIKEGSSTKASQSPFHSTRMDAQVTPMSFLQDHLPMFRHIGNTNPILKSQGSFRSNIETTISSWLYSF